MVRPERKGPQAEVVVAKLEAEVTSMSRSNWDVKEGILEVQGGGPVSLLKQAHDGGSCLHPEVWRVKELVEGGEADDGPPVALTSWVQGRFGCRNQEWSRESPRQPTCPGVELRVETCPRKVGG